MANHDRLCLANDDDDEFYVNTILKYKPKAGVEKKNLEVSEILFHRKMQKIIKKIIKDVSKSQGTKKTASDIRRRQSVLFQTCHTES